MLGWGDGARVSTSNVLMICIASIHILFVVLSYRLCSVMGIFHATVSPSNHEQRHQCSLYRIYRASHMLLPTIKYMLLENQSMPHPVHRSSTIYSRSKRRPEDARLIDDPSESSESLRAN